MPTAIGHRRAAGNRTRTKSKPNTRAAAEFPAGSLEAELSAIGNAVPAGEWAKVPADYFAKIDTYLHARTKKK